MPSTNMPSICCSHIEAITELSLKVFFEAPVESHQLLTFFSKKIQSCRIWPNNNKYTTERGCHFQDYLLSRRKSLKKHLWQPCQLMDIVMLPNYLFKSQESSKEIKCFVLINKSHENIKCRYISFLCAVELQLLKYNEVVKTSYHVQSNIESESSFLTLETSLKVSYKLVLSAFIAWSSSADGACLVWWFSCHDVT